MRSIGLPLLLVAALAASATAAPPRRVHHRHHHGPTQRGSRHALELDTPFNTPAPIPTAAGGATHTATAASAAAPAMTLTVAPRQSALPTPSSAPLALAVDAGASTPVRDVALAPPPSPVVLAPSLALTSLPPLPKAPTREHRWDLLGGGVALFLGGYALDVGLSYGLGHDTSTSLIPLAGPLLQLRDRWGTIGPTSTGNATVDQAGNAGISVVNQVIQDAAYVILSVDFVLQLAGAAMTVVGAVGHPPRRYAMPRDVAWSVAPGGVRVRF